MRRLIIALGLLTSLAGLGCKSGQQWNWSPKQLFGATTVPPPPTGQFGSGAAAPYYQGAPPPVNTTPPATGDPYVPPSGGFRSGQTNSGEPAARLVSVSPGGPNSGQRDEAVPMEEYAGRIRETPNWNDRVQPRGVGSPAAAYSQSGSGNNVRFVGEGSSPAGPDPVERAFTNGGQRSYTTRQQGASIDSRSSVRLASADVAQPIAQAQSAGSASQRQAPFGHARDYSWLKGQLESSADGQGWQLRYLPPGNRVDQYGGVMPLPNSRALEGYQAGQQIAVQGSVDHQDDGAGGFTPSYRLERIKPLEP